MVINTDDDDHDDHDDQDDNDDQDDDIEDDDIDKVINETTRWNFTESVMLYRPRPVSQ